MDLNEVYSNLCCKDPRHPDFEGCYGWMNDDPVAPRQNCSCDNCFYGRDKLALEIIKLLEIMVTSRPKLH